MAVQQYEKQILSGSTNGRPIAVAATSTPGTTIHTAVSGTDDIDEVWLYALNTSTSAVKLTIEFGGTGTSDKIEVTLAPGRPTAIVNGIPLQNSLVVRAFAGTTNVINVYGFVNRISLIS